MIGGGIAWGAFSWEAFATLSTGAMAVAAAVVVGLRQTDIQRRQARLQEMALRSDLFDRRYKVFEKAEQFVREILQKGDDPSPETQREFMVISGEAKFLFSSKVDEGLDEIWKRWVDFHALKETMNSSYRRQGHYGEGNPEKERIAFNWFAERFKTLPELFDELQLGMLPTH